MNSSKCEELDKNDITSEIKKKEFSQECNIIGNKKWKRTCPSCKLDVFYIDIKNRNKAEKNKVLCKKCSYISKRTHVPDDLTRHCSNCKCNIVYKNRQTYLYSIRNDSKCNSCYQLLNRNKGPFIRKCPTCNRDVEHKQKSHLTYAINNNRKCKYCANNHSNDIVFKRKQRIAKLNYLKRISGYQLSPTFNEDACSYFDELNIQNNWKLIHAKNGGEVYIKELGFYIDAYDKEKNIVVEYDEARHYDRYGNLRKKDVDRMNEIQQHLECEFWRYNEKTKTLKLYK
jgi:hypothetical protein